MAEVKKSAGRKTGAQKKNAAGSAAKTGKKSAAKASGKSKARKRAKKPKVVLSTKKVITFCVCICCFCALFLGLSVVLNSIPEKNLQKQENASFAQKKSQNSILNKDLAQKSSSELGADEKKPAENSAKTQVQKKSSSEDSSSQSSLQKKIEKSLPENVAKKSSTEKSAGQKSSENKVPAKSSAPQKNVSAQKKSGAPASKTAASLSNPAPGKSQASKNVQQTSSVKKTEKSVPAQKTASAKKAEPAQKSSLDQKNALAQKNSSAKKAAQAKAPEKKSSYVASSAGQKQNDNAQSQALKNPRFDIPKAVNGATVVIVIDDAGRSVENVKKYASLPFPLTIAVLPRLEHSHDCAQVSISLGKEVILHQPMQSVNHKLDPGPGKITVDMSFSEIADVISGNLASLGPGVKGMNNHEGSEVTGDVIRIGAVLDACQKHGIYFLDSRTTAATKAPQAALERDMRIYEKAGPYLDNDLTREKMTERMYETLRYANNHGHAVVIGHVDKSVKILPDLLAEMYPYMKAAGYRFATPSTLR